MNTKRLIMILVSGMLAATSAYSFPWFNKATYDSRLGYVPQTAPTTATSAQPAPGQTKSELQVAVMANSTSKPTGSDLWYGTDQRTRATHSR